MTMERKGEIIQDDSVIVLRSVYGKVGQKFFIQPMKDPKTGRYASCVREVDSNGNAILLRGDDEPGKRIIKTTDTFIVEDGKSYDLSDEYQKAEWEAIQHCPIIAMKRDERDAKGNLKIDGDAKRYGVGILYVEQPTAEVAKKVTKREQIHNAETYIFGDPAGADGRRMKARLLGKAFHNAPDADIKEFLLDIASRNPEEIINLYTAGDLGVRTLFLDAKDKGVIISRDKIYYYGETILGGTNEAVITWLKDPLRKTIVELIKRETYPDLYTAEVLDKTNKQKNKE